MKIPSVTIKPIKEEEREALAQIVKIRIMLNDPTKLTSLNSRLRKNLFKLCDVIEKKLLKR